MKVTLLKRTLKQAGGLEKYTALLSAQFVQSGCEVTIITAEKEPTFQVPKGVKIVEISNPYPGFLGIQSFDKSCKRWLEENKSDVVFGMERNSFQTHYRAGSGVHATFLKRRALLEPFFKRVGFQLNPLHHTLLSLEKKCFEHPQLKNIFTNSEMVKKEIVETYSVDEKKIDVVYNGAPLIQWKPFFEQSFEKKRKGPYEFLFIGNGYQRKGLLLLLKGLSELKTRDFRLTVIGYDKNLSYFVNMAETLNLKENVLFLGSQKELIPFYQRSDSLVIPSLYDPCANVTFEALSMGLFVISSPYNGGHELLKENSGCTLDNLGLEAMVKALEIALKHPKTEKTAREVRETIIGLDFSVQLDKIVQKTLS